MADPELTPEQAPQKSKLQEAKERIAALEAELQKSEAARAAADEDLVDAHRERTKAEARLKEMEDHERERQRLLEREKDHERAQLEAREKAKANGAPPKLLGQIPVYDQDEPDDVLSRAQEVRRGHIPIDRAKRFKTAAFVFVSTKSPLAKRVSASPPIGTEFDAEELDEADIRGLSHDGSIIAIG